MMKRTTRITIETEQVLIIRGANSSRAWCMRCGAEVDTVAMSAEGVLAETDRDTLQRWVETDQLHLSRAPDQSVRVCLRSLLKLAGRLLS